MTDDSVRNPTPTRPQAFLEDHLMPRHRSPGASRDPVRTALCLVITVMAGLARHASGHGAPFVVGHDAPTGKITVSPGIYRNLALEELFVLDPDVGIVSNDGTPGWTRSAALPAGTALDIRFLSPLLYWNPQTAASEPLPVPNASLVVDSAGGTTFISAAGPGSPAGIGGTNPSFLASFTSHHHVAWEILTPDASGLYGLWASLESTNPAAFAAQPSDPFLVVLNWGITDSTKYDTGVDRLAATAVPEPSALALVGIACAVVGWRWRRRSRPYNASP